MQDRLIFLVSPPRAGSTLLQRMLASHAEIFSPPEPHLLTPLYSEYSETEMWHRYQPDDIVFTSIGRHELDVARV